MTRHVETFAIDRGWIDAHAERPEWFDAIAYEHGAWTIPDPDQGEIGSLTNSGARAAAWRPFPASLGDDVAATCTWSGRRPFEGSPLVHVRPDDIGFGIGLWPIADFLKAGPDPQPVWVLGVIGRDPSQFKALPGAWTHEVEHVDGTPRELEIRSRGGEVSAWVDGQLIIGPVPIPDGLRGSPNHGVCLDVNQHPARPACAPVLLGPLVVEALTPDKIATLDGLPASRADAPPVQADSSGTS